MQHPNQAFGISVAAVRRSNRLLLLLTCLPLLTACTVLAGVRSVERLSQASDRRLGNLKQSQAADMARILCTRVTGFPAEVLDASGHTAPAATDTSRPWNEWQVQCRAGASRYLLRLDANHREVLVILRERQEGQAGPDPQRTENASGEAGAPGDLPPGRLSDRETPLWARRYLSLVGLPLPADARLVRNPGGYDFVYKCSSGTAAGQRRMLRVRIDPQDGSLVYLENVLYRRTPRASTSSSRFIAAVEPLTSSHR